MHAVATSNFSQQNIVKLEPERALTSCMLAAARPHCISLRQIFVKKLIC
jgi:hypothetical protein